MTTAIILAAGKGKRMNSNIPKPLVMWKGRHMICYVIDAIKKTGVQKIIIVIGHQGELVRTTLEQLYEGLIFVEQKEQLGTAHAVGSCMHLLDSDVLVLCCDHPRIDYKIIKQFIDDSVGKKAAVLTMILEDSRGYGRIIRNPETNNFATTVEERDCTEEQKTVKEVSTGVLFFTAHTLITKLPLVSKTKDEYYLPDVLKLVEDPADIGLTIAPNPKDFQGVNTSDELLLL